MFHNRDFELDLVAHCLKKPIYLKQHKEQLSKMKFNDKFIDIVYKNIFKCLESYRTVPTVTELQKIARDNMAENEKFNFLEIEATQELISDLYSRSTTDMTGVSISNYLMETEAKKLSEELATHKGEDLTANLGDYERQLAKMKHFFSDDEDLGHNFFSQDGIAHAKRLLDDYNNMACLPTGFKVLDHCLQGGMRRGELAVILAATNVGKAQKKDALVMGPLGTKRMGDLAIGDEVFDWAGNAVSVKGVFPQGTKKNYRVDFSDGTSTECCDEHLWWARRSDSSNKEWQCLPLKNIMTCLKGPRGRVNWFIPVNDAVQYAEKEFTILPYTLGAILGDGGITGNAVKFTSADPELISYLKEELISGITLNKYKTKTGIDYGFARELGTPLENVYTKELRRLNLMGTCSHNKFIPEEYKYGSIEQRLELLKGLCDTDGALGGSAHTAVDYCCASLQLVEDIQYIVRSLGGVAEKIQERVIKEYPDNVYYRVYFTLPMCPFKLSRKADKWVAPKKPLKKGILDVTFVGEEEMQCISVDSPTSSYLTNDFIVTHNTAVLLNFAAQFLKSGLRVCYIVMDNLEAEMISRTVGCLMDFDITQGLDADAAMENVADRFHDHMENNFWYKHYGPRELTTKKLERYLDKLETTLYEIDREQDLRPKEKWGKIDILVMDYVDVMLPERSENPWESQDHLMQEIKCILKNRDILGITATQGGTEAMKSDTGKMYQAQGFKARFNAPDLVFAISQDESEKALYPSVFRLGCLKARRAKVNYQIQFQFWREKQVIKEIDNAVILTMSSERTTDSGQKVKATNNYSDLYGIKANLKEALEKEKVKEDETDQEISRDAELITLDGET